MCSHMAKNNFQANNNNNKQRQLQLQFPSRGSSVRIIFLCSSSKPNTVPQTWPQGFKPRLGCSLFGIELLWSVSINYPDFTTVHSVPLFRVCRVITGRTCLKLLFSRWQSSNTQELVSPTMCLPHAGAYTEHLGFTEHRAATGLAALQWVMVKVLAEEEKLQIPGTQKANTLYLKEKLCWPDTGFDCRWARFLQPEGGDVGLKELNPDWMWSRSKVQSVQLWEREKEWKVNRLDSEVCVAAFDESRQSAAAQWQGDLPRQRSSQHSQILFSCLLTEKCRVWPLFVACIFIR